MCYALFSRNYKTIYAVGRKYRIISILILTIFCERKFEMFPHDIVSILCVAKKYQRDQKK